MDVESGQSGAFQEIKKQLWSMYQLTDPAPTAAAEQVYGVVDDDTGD
jgi:hypothetical protein